jgi:hypothetical protein
MANASAIEMFELIRTVLPRCVTAKMAIRSSEIRE